MSKTTKRKHVTKEALDEYYVPEGDEEVVKILGGRGNNLHEVQSADGKTFLASMPTKFRKNLWIKRGDFVVISPIKEGNKVQAEIVYVLYNKQIKYLQDQNLWPENFVEKEEVIECKESHREHKYSCSSEEEEDDLLFKNPNRREFVHVEDSESSSNDDEESDDEESNLEQNEEDVDGQQDDLKDEIKSFDDLNIS